MKMLPKTVSTTKSQTSNKKSKGSPRFQFSVLAYDGSTESTNDTAPPQSTLNKSDNGSKISARLNKAHIL